MPVCLHVRRSSHHAAPETDETEDPPLWTLYHDELYKQRLPRSSCAWDSAEGRRRFREAVLAKTAECYFRLFCHFESQNDPATCGPATLAIILNALDLWMVDRGASSAKEEAAWQQELFERTLHRPWGNVLRKGITLDDFVAVARAAGAYLDITYAGPDQAAFAYGAEPLAPGDGERTFREVVKQCAGTSDGTFLALTYSRYALRQTGDGHFSPLGAYHEGTDSVLILDSAKFKYPPHWVPLPLLWQSMQRTDWSTGRSRGYIAISKPDASAGRHAGAAVIRTVAGATRLPTDKPAGTGKSSGLAPAMH